MEDDRSYFARRADEERSAAEKSEDPKAREAHRQMAERYEEQALTANAPKVGAA